MLKLHYPMIQFLIIKVTLVANGYMPMMHKMIRRLPVLAIYFYGRQVPWGRGTISEWKVYYRGTSSVKTGRLN